jgi:MFS family permease
MAVHRLRGIALSVDVSIVGILIGDLVITLVLTTHADSFGRKKTLLIGALLMLGAGIAFGVSGNLWVLLIAGIIGVISPSGGEIGPFLACEQAGLTQLLKENATSAEVTSILSWYNLIGYVGIASMPLNITRITIFMSCSWRSGRRISQSSNIGRTCD